MGKEHWYKRKEPLKIFGHISPRKKSEGPLDKYLFPSHKKKNRILSNG